MNINLQEKQEGRINYLTGRQNYLFDYVQLIIIIWGCVQEIVRILFARLEGEFTKGRFAYSNDRENML